MLDRGTPEHQHSQDESSKYARSGMSRVDKSRVDPSNRQNGDRHTSREGTTGNMERVGFQDQIGVAGGDGKNPEGSKSGEEEARSPKVLEAIMQVSGVKTEPGEVKQNSGGAQGVTFPGTPRRDFHTSSGSDTGTKKSRKDRHRHFASNSQKTSHAESPSDRLYEREADKAKEAVKMSYEPDRPSGEQDKLRYGGKQNWSKETDDDKGISGRDEGPEKGSAGGRKPERE